MDLFFCLSGFVFFRLYGNRIKTRQIGGYEFFILRFSRLYPLHFLTLAVVAIGQCVAMVGWGKYFVYAFNDTRHFLLQLFLISNWGFEQGYSFNGPIWSVSVEIFLYAVFFCVGRWASGWGTTTVLLFSVLGYVLDGTGTSTTLGAGLHSFFLGGLTCMIYDRVFRSPNARAWRIVIGFAALGLWVVVFADSKWNILDHRIPLLENYRIPLTRALLFPVTVLALALSEKGETGWGKRWAVIGDMSYASYLWHFPLQMVFVSVARSIDLPTEYFYRPMSLLLFFAVLIPLSWASFTFYERPVQKFIRTGCVRKNPELAWRGKEIG